MLTSSGNAINPLEFGNFYKPSAESCFTYSAKPNCKQASEFISCFRNKSISANNEVGTECGKRFPVENIHLIPLTAEVLAKHETIACRVACISEKLHMYTDDGKIDLSFINPHIHFEFNATEVVLKCDENNKQESQCQRKGNIYVCVNYAFQKAKHEYNERKKLQNNKTKV